MAHPPLPERRIDLNADLGERTGSDGRASDAALLDVVTSANVACGVHAGNPMVMRETVRAAAQRGVAIGAHPSYPDPTGFGRRELAATPDEIAADVLYQLGALHACCAAEGTRVRYVKPHGALYNRAMRDDAAAEAIVTAIHAVDSTLLVLGLPNSALLREAKRVGLGVAREAFLDRGYRADGTLVPRDQPGALLHDVDAIVARTLRLVQGGILVAHDGTELVLTADSLCTHGDGPAALAIVRAVRSALEQHGIAIAPFASSISG